MDTHVAVEVTIGAVPRQVGYRMSGSNIDEAVAKEDLDCPRVSGVAAKGTLHFGGVGGDDRFRVGMGDKRVLPNSL